MSSNNDDHGSKKRHREEDKELPSNKRSKISISGADEGGTAASGKQQQEPAPGDYDTIRAAFYDLLKCKLGRRCDGRKATSNEVERLGGEMLQAVKSEDYVLAAIINYEIIEIKSKSMLAVGPEDNTQFLRIKNPGIDYEQIINCIYPDPIKPGSDLYFLLKEKISDLSKMNDPSNSDKRLLLELKKIVSPKFPKISGGSIDEGTDSGTASDCGDDEEKLRAYKIAVPRFLSLVTTALAVDEYKNIKDHAAARDFVMYLVNLFLDEYKKLKQTNTKKALCILKQTNPETDSVAEATIKNRDISMVCQAIVGALFDGDQASIQNVATDATKAFEFMSNEMPQDPVPHFFVLNAYDVSAGVINNKPLPLKVQSEYFFLGIRASSAHPSTHVATHSPPDIATHSTAYVATHSPPDIATYSTADIATHSKAAVATPVESKAVASEIFNPQNICKNMVMRSALMFSDSTDRKVDLQEVLAQQLYDPFSTEERAGAGLLLKADKFTIVEKVGHGSFSMVYKAIYDGMLVAVKIMTVRAADVLKEAYRALTCPALLEDKHVVRTLGYIILNQNELEKKVKSNSMKRNDVLYIGVVDELGQYNLKEYNNDWTRSLVSSGGEPRLKQVRWNKIMSNTCDKFLSPLLQLLEALAEGSKKNIQHRDFKPENVMFVGDRFKIADWGTARNPDVQVADATRRDVGTELYAPPEVERADYGVFTDVYSFGIVAYEMLVGRYPGKVTEKLSDDWFNKEEDSKYIFRYTAKSKQDRSVTLDIGPKLKEWICGMIEFNPISRSKPEVALHTLKEIVKLHQVSK